MIYHFRTTIAILIVVFLLQSSAYSYTVEPQGIWRVDDKFVISGYTEKTIMILVQKDTESTRFYPEIKDNNYEENIYFYFGEGVYTVSIYTLKTAQTWELHQYFTVNYQGDYEYTEHPEIVKLAYSLFRDSDSDWNKFVYIYRYMYNIQYDKEAAKRIDDGTDDGIHTALKTIREGKGICLDYAILFKALCDIAGIPCEIVKGTFKGQGHAWNEVYLEDLGWIYVDATLKLWNDENYKEFYEKGL